MSDSDSEEFPTGRSSPNERVPSNIPRTQNFLDSLIGQMANGNNVVEMEQSDNSGDEYGSNEQSFEEGSRSPTGQANAVIRQDVLLNLIKSANLPTTRFGGINQPNNNLLQQMDIAAELAKQGLDVPGSPTGDQIETLMVKVLQPTMIKVLFEDVHLNMENNRMIMGMLYRWLSIFVAKLTHGHVPLDPSSHVWHMVRYVFMQQNRFYSRTIAYSSDLVVCIMPGDIAMPSPIIRRDGHFSDWFATILVWFHKIRGYEALLHYIRTNVPEDCSLEEYFFQIDWVIMPCSFFTSEFLRQHMLPIVMPLIEKMMELTDDDLNKTSLDMRENLMGKALFHIRQFVTHCKDDHDMESYNIGHKAYSLKLKLIMRSIAHGNFVQRMVAIDEFTRMISDRGYLEMTDTDLMEFIRRENVIEQLYKDNLHHLTYVDRLLRTMNIMLERRLIDVNVLDVIWEQQLGKHDAIQRNVIQLLSKMASYFPDEFFAAFFQKLEKSWTNGDEKVKDVVMDMLRRLGIELSCHLIFDKSQFVRKIIQILWRWSSTADDALREKLYGVIFDILHESVTLTARRDYTILEDQIMQTAERCLDPSSCCGSDDPTSPALALLKKLINMMPEENILDDQNRYDGGVLGLYAKLAGKQALESKMHKKRAMIRRLDSRFCTPEELLAESTAFVFGQKIAENICDWIEEQAVRLRDIPDDGMDTDSSASESDNPDDILIMNLRKRLEFLHFMMFECRQIYREEFAVFKCPWMATLWKKMIIGTTHCLQTIGFRFFRDVVVTILEGNDRDTEFHEDNLRFFRECVLSFPAENLPQAGFKCYAIFLRFINISKGILEYTSTIGEDEEDQVYILCDSDFEGEHYLYNVIMYADDVTQKAASSLLEKMYTSYIKFKDYSEADNKIIVNKCVKWLNSVIEMRKTMRREDGLRMVKNTVMTILEVVEKNESDVKLCIRNHSSLRRAIALHGFKVNLNFKIEDVHMLFSTPMIPKHLGDSIGVSLNDNMILFELVQLAVRVLRNQGAEITPYPVLLVKKSLSGHTKASKLHQSDWGSTIKESGIHEPGSVTARTEKSRVAVEPIFDLKYQNMISPECCTENELKLISYQLSQHSDFVEKLLELADEKELLENCFQLLASLPIKRFPGHPKKFASAEETYTVEEFNKLLESYRVEKSISKRLYFLFFLFEYILPSTSPETKNNNTALKLFFESEGFSFLLNMFGRLSTAKEDELEFEMFCCDILFRLVPGLIQIYLVKSDKQSFRQMICNLDLKLDPFMDDIGKMFTIPVVLPKLDYTLNTLLMIVRAGSKFMSNSNGNIFYSAVLESRSGEDDEALLDDDSDPAEDQSDHMVFACLGLLALLCINNPQRGQELLECTEFHKFLVGCCNSDNETNDYSALIPTLFFTIENHLGTNHLMERLLDHMFGQLDTGSKVFWNVLLRLLDKFHRCHDGSLSRIDDYVQEMITWMELAQKETEECLGHYPSQLSLTGRLNLAYALFDKLDVEVKEQIGMHEGENLIDRLLFNFLIPSSKEFYELRHKENGLVRSHTTLEAVKDVEMDIGQSVPRSTSCMLPSRAVSVCKSEESQIAAYKLLTVLSDSYDCLRKIVETTRKLFFDNPEGLIPWDYQPDNNLRAPGNYVGLKNGGATCYMNSILQQLYMIPEVRDPLLAVNLPEELSEESYPVKIIAALQSVFANLAGSELEAYTPDEFWTIFKMNERIVNVHEQQDAYEFYNKVVDLIDEGMQKVGAPKIGTTVFGGLFADEKICKDCPHRYSREEPFTSISIDVRSHNNMNDSLNEFVRGDVLENDNAYHCEKCDKKVRAVKRLTIKSLPENLVIQQKRFDFDWERNEPVKFNDYFEFPFTVDMRPFTTEAMNAKDAASESETSPVAETVQDFENYIYELRGVVVHSGQATGGHYFSYIRASDPPKQWYKFDDTEVTMYPCDLQDVKHKWFGEDPNAASDGYNRRRTRVWWNAFILFYEKVTPTVPVNKPSLASLISSPGVPLTLPLTVDPFIPILDISRRNSTASPVTRLHKRFSTMSLKSRPRYIPPRLERKVRNMNTRIMHEKNEYSYPFYQFMYELACRHIEEEDDEIALLITELLAQFMFQTMIRSAPIRRRDCEMVFNKDKVVSVFIKYLRNKTCRLWFITNVVLDENLSRSYLMSMLGVASSDKLLYSKILAHLLNECLRAGDRIDDLNSLRTAHVVNVLHKRRLKSKMLHDLLLESLNTLFREDTNEEISTIFTLIFEPIWARSYLKCGFLTSCLRYFEQYRYWENIFGPLLQVAAQLFCHIDLRPHLKRRTGLERDDVSPAMLAPLDEAVLLEQCLDYTDVANTLFYNSSEKIVKFVEMLVIQFGRDTSFYGADIAAMCLCWNNYTVTQKVVQQIVKILEQKHVDFSYVRVLEVLYSVVNQKDSVFASRKLMRWFFKDMRLDDVLDPRTPSHSVKHLSSAKVDFFHTRVLQACCIMFEAYGNHSDPDFVGPKLGAFLREERIGFLGRIREKYLSPELNAQVMAVDTHSYQSQLVAIPSEHDVLIRLLVKAREVYENQVDEEMSNSEIDQEMDTDEGEETPEQPLDLTVGMMSARSSVTTPMLAEKRTLLQEDLDPPNEPGEAKKSRYSDNGDDDPDMSISQAITNSTSVVDYQERTSSALPPPPYEDDESQA